VHLPEGEDIGQFATGKMQTLTGAGPSGRAL